MSLVGIINSDPGLESRIRNLFNAESGDNFSLHIASGPERVKEVLNYDLPEIVVINLTDPQIDFTRVFEEVRKDLWLHNFGIIALYDKRQMSDEKASSQLKDYNILAVLEYSRIDRHLVKFVKIIDANQQIIFQYDLADKLSGVISGSFILENDLASIPVYSALSLATLFQHGFIASGKKMNMLLVMQELMINAIEHGNCKISFNEKSTWLADGNNIADLVAEKNQDPQISKKKVFVEWEITADCSRFVIRDEGDGFDVQKYKEMYDADSEGLSGRGILLVKSLVRRLTYNKKGNIVSFTIDHDKDIMRDAPLGFSGEDVIFPSPGDYIFREGEDSDFLYYISSGTYSASLRGKPVGTIDAGDIFMGEMAFLLNNKRTVTVKANSRGKLVKVSRKSFVNIIREYPHYGIFLAKLLARKLARSNRVSSERVI
jgi:hypothetical protein